MDIRSITGLVSLTDPLSPSIPQHMGLLAQAARDAFARAGWPIQTVRLATQPIEQIAPRAPADFARALQAACKENGIDFASLGAVQADAPDAALEWIDALPAALAATQDVFGAVQIASRTHGIRLPAVRAVGRTMRALADRMPDGFGNFRFAALANCPPLSPFFPVAYHDGGEPAFAIAPEGASLAVDAFAEAETLDQARRNLVRAVEDTARGMARVAGDLASRWGWRFAGIDFSLAPSPVAAASIGAAIERLTGVPFGDHGTLFAAGFLTDCLRRADFPRTGFSGLMFPVLEDATLAARSSGYTLDSLLLYSTVCGTGLDTIPLPGDTSAEALSAILLDLATLAVKLDKPLTARLIPIQGLRAGDRTQFNHRYMANATVMDPRAGAVRALESNEQVEMRNK